MSKKIEVKVRAESAFGKAVEFMRKKQIFTKKELVDFLKGMGKSDTAALASAVVLLSPRENSKIGDPRGNPSAGYGHQAFLEKLTRKVVDGKKEKQRFRWRMRKVELERLYKVQPSKKVESEKVVAAVPAVAPVPAVVNDAPVEA